MKKPHRKTIRMLLADDQEFIRKAVSNYIPLLGSEFEVVGEAADGKALLRLLRTTPADLIILDLEMPEMNGFQVLRELNRNNACPNTKVLVFSAHYNEFFYKELVLLGAACYLPKNCSAKDFVTAVRAVVTQGFYLLPEVTREAVTELIRDSKIHFLLGRHELGRREVEVLRLFCDGLLYKEIADVLQIAEDTVKYHIKTIYRKTATSTHAELIKYAIRTGITDLAQPFVRTRQAAPGK